MKIMIINPNSSEDMSKIIDDCAQKFAGKDFEVVTKSTPGAPAFIDTYQDRALAAAGMMELVRTYEKEVDAFIVACHCDPNLEVLKEMTDKVVVGIGEASMKMATMLGHRFSVVSTGRRSIPLKESMIHHYHLDHCAASVRCPLEEDPDKSMEEKLFEAAHLAVEEDHAEVIVLGCAGLCDLAERMQEELKVPVLDGVICALILASGLVKAGLSTSKLCRYRN